MSAYYDRDTALLARQQRLEMSSNIVRQLHDFTEIGSRTPRYWLLGAIYEYLGLMCFVATETFPRKMGIARTMGTKAIDRNATELENQASSDSIKYSGDFFDSVLFSYFRMWGMVNLGQDSFKLTKNLTYANIFHMLHKLHARVYYFRFNSINSNPLTSPEEKLFTARLEMMLVHQMMDVSVVCNYYDPIGPSGMVAGISKAEVQDYLANRNKHVSNAIFASRDNLHDLQSIGLENMTLDAIDPKDKFKVLDANRKHQYVRPDEREDEANDEDEDDDEE